MLKIQSEPRSALAECLLSILLLLVGGLACGRGEAAPANSTVTPLDACQLLTKADVETVYGTVVGEPQQKLLGRAPFWVSMCTYDNGEFDAPILSIGLLIKAHGVNGGPAQAYDAHGAELREELGDAAVPVAVAGVGACAGWSADVGQLMVFEPYELILTANRRFAGNRLTLSTQLADRVLSRLPAK